MIKLPISPTALAARVDAFDPGWKGRAATKLTEALKVGHVGSKDGIWSDIKEVYTELQGWKCAYCERPLPRPAPGAGGARGLGEYDVEHFRPKNAVKPWPTQRKKKRRKITYDGRLGTGDPAGYLRLAFDPLNYAVTCRTCNSELKANAFPILGLADAASSDRKTLDDGEMPCLILPLGDLARDPAELLEWFGPVVRVRPGLSPADRIAALTIIDFFELDDRADLVLQRCWVIHLLHANLVDGNLQYAKDVSQPNRSFAGCVRDFLSLFAKDPPEAARVAGVCRDYAQKLDPNILQGF